MKDSDAGNAPHLLRSTPGVPLRDVREVARHADPRTTNALQPKTHPSIATPPTSSPPSSLAPRAEPHRSGVRAPERVGARAPDRAQGAAAAQGVDQV